MKNPTKSSREDVPRINENIDSDQVRVIDSKGENIGVIQTVAAIEMASNEDLDLVEISPHAKPPVARIMDYGKYKYEQQKKKYEAKKKQKVIEVKEIKVRPNIETHDYNVKLTAARKFIEQGNKVKITLRFRGREMHHREIGEAILHRLRDDLEDIAKPEFEPRLEERQVIMMMISIK